jgi:putative ABC transport system ATP-binding protein
MVYPGLTPVNALSNVNLVIRGGELVSVIGKSGSGKSTLLNILGLIDRPSAGSYKVRGVETNSLNEVRRTALRSSVFGFVFQDSHLLEDRTALENTELALMYRRLPRKERSQRSMGALEMVGMARFRHAFPGNLSGGERQRVAIARTLAQGTEVILCDEPTGNLDQHNSEAIIDLLRELNGAGRTVIIITHDHDIASACPRCLKMTDGVMAVPCSDIGGTEWNPLR